LPQIYVKTELGGCNRESVLRSADLETKEDVVIITPSKDSLDVFVGLNYVCCAPFETKCETKDDILHMYIIDTCKFGVDECHCRCMCYYTFDFFFKHDGNYGQPYKIWLIDPRVDNPVLISEGNLYDKK
jgi:hypothetical protein